MQDTDTRPEAQPETVGDVLAGLNKILDETWAARRLAMVQEMAAFVVESLAEHEAFAEVWEGAGIEHRRGLTGEWLARFEQIIIDVEDDGS